MRSVLHAIAAALAGLAPVALPAQDAPPVAPAPAAGPAAATTSDSTTSDPTRPVSATAPATAPGLPAEGGASPAAPDPDAPARVADMAFRRALALADRGDWVFARAEAEAAGPLAVEVIDWRRLRAGQGAFSDYADFVVAHPDWPGMDLLRRRAEAKLTGVPPDRVVAWFAAARPMTPRGATALIAAFDALGRGAEGDAAARAAWGDMAFTAQEQTAFLAAYGPRVTEGTPARLGAMLNRGATDQAERLTGMVAPDLKALALARIALQRRAPGVDALIRAVPDALRGDPGLLRDQAQWRWRAGMEAGAADLVLAVSDSAQTLGDPAAWASLRAGLARYYLRQNDPATAYKLAARHRMAAGGASWADLEWLAGYAALKRGDAPVALGHFDALAAGVRSPISAARAAYWQGRALDYLGRPADAQAAWRRGAGWQTAFYGLLSAEKAGLPLDPEFSWPASLPPWQGAEFTRRDLFAVATRLRDAGALQTARQFLNQIQMTEPADQIAPMASLAESWGDAKQALVFAKRAANGGEVLTRAYYPLPDLPTGNLPVSEDLALSIARRESEFDPVVASGAGALGLMQLMPGTARLMAPVIGEDFDQARLTADPGYNIRLGSAYLARLRDEFGTSPVLIAAGYNAGPGRARQWIADLGDPRDPSVDIVDWIEAIPFGETRDYVMRVAESLPVYRARLGFDMAGPVNFTAELRGSPPPVPDDVDEAVEGGAPPPALGLPVQTAPVVDGGASDAPLSDAPASDPSGGDSDAP